MTVRSTPRCWARASWLLTAPWAAAERIWYPRGPPGRSATASRAALAYARKTTPKPHPRSPANAPTQLGGPPTSSGDEQCHPPPHHRPKSAVSKILCLTDDLLCL